MLFIRLSVTECDSGPHCSQVVKTANVPKTRKCVPAIIFLFTRLKHQETFCVFIKEKLISMLLVSLQAKFRLTGEAIQGRNMYLAPVQETNERGAGLQFQVL